MADVCPSCRTSIPASQTFCPRCYKEIGTSGAHPEQECKQRSSLGVMFFLSDDGAEYYEMTYRLFGVPPGYRVKICFYAENAETFTEMTEKSAGRWDILVLDAESVPAADKDLRKFLSANPRTVVALRYPSDEREFATTLEHGRCVHFAKPKSFAERIEMIDRLLTVAASVDES